MKLKTGLILALATFLFVPAAVLAGEDSQDISMEGLELVDKTRRSETWVAPGIDWTIYTQVALDQASVSFRKNWQRDQNRNLSFKVRADDMERIKETLSRHFDDIFSEELTTQGGYMLATESGENVMRITPRIVDLDVYAPDTRNAGATRSFTDSAGRMTLKLQIFDSVTGDLIASLSDRRESPRRGYMQWTTSVSNNAEARRMLERWARDLREKLDEARKQPPK